MKKLVLIKDKEYYKQLSKERKKEILKWFIEYKKNSKCSRCGSSHPAIIEFHHIEPVDKNLEISTMVHRGFSKNKIMREISKCEVLCSNCHKVLHWEKDGRDFFV